MDRLAAKQIYEAYLLKLRGKTPTPGESKDIERYRAFAEGRDPKELKYDPAQQPDAEDDV